MRYFKFKLFSRLTLAVLAILFLQSCASFRSPHTKKVIAKKDSLHSSASKDIVKTKSNVKTRLALTIDNFDRKSYPNDAQIISKMIAVVQPELLQKERNIIASHISKAIKTYKVEPQIMVAIIDTESDFNPKKVSTTGDISLAQINLGVWNKEFIRMKKPPMNVHKVRHDQEYALLKMAEILCIIKKRYEKKDRRWYARYHSNTNKYKNEYLHKLEIRMKLLANARGLDTRIALAN